MSNIDNELGTETEKERTKDVKAWKVVDTFNGAVEGYVHTYEEGETLAQKVKEKYYSHPGTQNDILPLDIVPATAKWRWNEIENGYTWDYEVDDEYYANW